MNDQPAASPLVEWALAPWQFALRAAQAWPALVPQALTQPINPGWTFGNLIQVNAQNSSAPDTEQAVLRRHSYGRQIGRVMDAVELLLERAEPAARRDPRAQDFDVLQREVAAIKREQSTARLQRLRDELLRLREQQPEAWRELRALLKD